MAGQKGGRITISMVYAANAKLARELDKVSRQTSRNFAKISKEMAIMNSRGAKTVSVTNKMGKSLSRIASLGTLTVAFQALKQATAIVRDFAYAILNVMSHLADFENRVKVAFGVFTDVGNHMRYVSNLSNKLGVNIRASRESFAKLSVAASLSGLKIGEIKEIYESVSEAARVYNLSADRTRLSFLAIEQMINKGKVSYEELRRQLGEQIPGAFQLAAKAMGVTTKELDKLLVKGEVYTEDFLPKFARALRESVADQLEEATTRGISNIARLRNATQKWFETFSNRELEEGLGNFSKELAKLIENSHALAISLQKVLSVVVKIGEYTAAGGTQITSAIFGKSPEVRLSEIADWKKRFGGYLDDQRSELTDQIDAKDGPILPGRDFDKAWINPLHRLGMTKFSPFKDAIRKLYQDAGAEDILALLENPNLRRQEGAISRTRGNIRASSFERQRLEDEEREIYRENVELIPGYTGTTAKRTRGPARADLKASQMAIADQQRNERNAHRLYWDNRRAGGRQTQWAEDRARAEKIFSEQLKIQMTFEETEKTQRATHYAAMMKAQEDFNKREVEARKAMLESWSEISESITSGFKGLADSSLTAAEALNRVAEALLEKFAYKPFENFLTNNLSSLFGAATGAGGGDGIGTGVKGIIAALNGAGRSPGYGGGSGFNITNNFGSTVNPATQNAIVKNQFQIFGGG